MSTQVNTTPTKTHGWDVRLRTRSRDASSPTDVDVMSTDATLAREKRDRIHRFVGMADVFVVLAGFVAVVFLPWRLEWLLMTAAVCVVLLLIFEVVAVRLLRPLTAMVNTNPTFYYTNRAVVALFVKLCATGSHFTTDPNQLAEAVLLMTEGDDLFSTEKLVNHLMKLLLDERYANDVVKLVRLVAQTGNPNTLDTARDGVQEMWNSYKTTEKPRKQRATERHYASCPIDPTRFAEPDLSEEVAAVVQHNFDTRRSTTPVHEDA